MCASANAFSQSNVTTVNNSSNEAVGQTVITVADGSKFVVGDIITFAGDANQYKISAISSNDITIHLKSDKSQGLQVEVFNGVNISREWEFAPNFTKAPGLLVQMQLLMECQMMSCMLSLLMKMVKLLES